MNAVIGGDLSLKRTGICLPNGQTFHIATGEKVRGDYRLHDLGRAWRHYLRANPCDLAVLEHPVRFQSADAAIAVGMAHGVCREILAELRIPVALINPSTLKMFACGKGSADKAEMIAAANRHREARRAWPGAPEIRPIVDDNEADAWWLRAMGLWHLGERVVNESADSFLHADTVREKACHGPWKVEGKSGAKWPEVGARTAARATTRPRATRGRL